MPPSSDPPNPPDHPHALREGRLSPLLEHADRAVYILVTLVAVLVVEEQAGVPVGQAIAGAIATVLALTFAELFARQLGIRVREERMLTRDDWMQGLEAAVVGLLAAAIPIGALSLASLDAIGLDTAYNIAEWTGVGVIAGYSLYVGWRAGLSWHRAILVALSFSMIGVALIAVKALIK